MKSKSPHLNLEKLHAHPLAKLVPIIGTEEYKILCKSIRENGLQNEIVLFEDAILDGNNRYTACKKAKVEPRFRQFNPDKDGSPIDFIIANSLGRRNLTPSQAATLGANLAEEFKKQEKALKDAAKAESANLRSGKKEKKPKEKKGKTTAKAAKIAGSSPRNVEKAAALKKEDPEKFAEVQAGKTTLNAATKEVAKKKTAAERASDEFDVCRVLIGKVYSEADAAKAERNLSAKEFIKLAGLDEDEMKRVKEFICEAKWTLKNAMSYKSVSLTYAHNLRQLIDRTIASGGKYILELGEYLVTVTKKPVDPDAK